MPQTGIKFQQNGKKLLFTFSVVQQNTQSCIFTFNDYLPVYGFFSIKLSYLTKPLVYNLRNLFLNYKYFKQLT